MEYANSDIAITGLGWTTALGDTIDGVWDRVVRRESGLGPLTLFDSKRHGHIPVGQIHGDLAAASGLESGSRSDHLAVLAARSALCSAGLDERDAQAIRSTAGIVLGACTGGMLESETFLDGLIHEQVFRLDLLRHHLLSSPAKACAKALGLGPLRATVSTACASGASALAVAGDMLRAGQADVMVAGGVDALTRLTLGGFGSLLIMDPEGCRPFDRDRAGMNLGEAAALLVLETAESALRRGARVHAWLTGWGAACDAVHATRPAPDGAGLVSAMRRALAMAGVQPDDIDYINAHGTGTIDNERAEDAAVRTVFAYPPALSSTKRGFGHTLAAAGAVEAIVSVLALRHQVAPGTAGLTNIDPEIGIRPLTTSKPLSAQWAMSNSQGFGGNCCSLVLRHGESDR